MRQFNGVAAAVAVACGGLCSVASANLLVNPGFEDPITQDGPPFVGSWEGFNGGASSAAFNGTVMPRTGAQHLNLNITAPSTNNFAGAFQDVVGLTAGTNWTFSGWHKSDVAGYAGAEVRIEWRNSTSNSEISRTPNLVPSISTDYTQFSLMATVPAGADSARVVYAIQSFSGPNFGNVFVDDVSFIPAPGAATVMLGAFGLAARRRRRA